MLLLLSVSLDGHVVQELEVTNLEANITRAFILLNYRSLACTNEWSLGRSISLDSWISGRLHLWTVSVVGIPVGIVIDIVVVVVVIIVGVVVCAVIVVVVLAWTPIVIVVVVREVR